MLVNLGLHRPELGPKQAVRDESGRNLGSRSTCLTNLGQPLGNNFNFLFAILGLSQDAAFTILASSPPPLPRATQAPAQIHWQATALSALVPESSAGIVAGGSPCRRWWLLGKAAIVAPHHSCELQRWPKCRGPERNNNAAAAHPGTPCITAIVIQQAQSHALRASVSLSAEAVPSTENMSRNAPLRVNTAWAHGQSLGNSSWSMVHVTEHGSGIFVPQFWGRTSRTKA